MIDVSAQEITDTPVPTETSTPTPTFRPLFSTPTKDIINYSCPGSQPVGWGTVTPSANWLLNCAQCVTPIPDYDWGDNPLESTPETTTTITPTVVTEDPLFDPQKVMGRLTYNNLEVDYPLDWDRLYDFGGTYTYYAYNDIRVHLNYEDDNINYPHKYDFWTNAHLSGSISIPGGGPSYNYTTIGTFIISNDGCTDGLEIWNLDSGELIVDLDKSLGHAFPYFSINQIQGGSASFNGNWDIFCKGKNNITESAYRIYLVNSSLIVNPSVETDFIMGLGRYNQEPTLPDSYCNEVIPEDGNNSGEDDSFKIPIPIVGNSSCVYIPNIHIPLDWLSAVWSDASDIDIPGMNICFDPIYFGELSIFGLNINLDLLALIIGMTFIIRLITRS